MQTETMRSVWTRYVNGWMNVDAEERQQMLQESVAPSCVYVDPDGQDQGHAGLTGRMEQFQRNFPGATIEIEKFAGHHDYALIHWRALDASGVVLLPGVDAVSFNEDGLLAQITVWPETTSV